MATILELAKMASAVYDNTPNVPGWQLELHPGSSNLCDLFKGAAFRNGTETVYAFKGTSQLKDWATNAAYGLFGMNTFQFARADDFLRASLTRRDRIVSVCGHSLGGAIAQVIGNRRHLPFATFNAPGVGVLSGNIAELSQTLVLGTSDLRLAGGAISALLHPVQFYQDVVNTFYRVRGVNFQLHGDPVSPIGVHYGSIVRLPGLPSVRRPFDIHAMKHMLQVIDGSRYRSMSLAAVTA